MKTQQPEDYRLLDYLDGKLEGVNLQALRNDLEKSPELQQRLEVLRVIHRQLAASKLDSPSPKFVQSVMQKVAIQRPSSSGLSPRNGILLALGVMAAAVILAAMVNTGIFDQVTDLVDLKTPTGMNKYVPEFSAPVNISGKMIVNFCLGIALVFTFLILDRTVLRPFFQRRAGTMI